MGVDQAPPLRWGPANVGGQQRPSQRKNLTAASHSKSRVIRGLKADSWRLTAFLRRPIPTSGCFQHKTNGRGEPLPVGLLPLQIPTARRSQRIKLRGWFAQGPSPQLSTLNPTPPLVNNQGEKTKDLVSRKAKNEPVLGRERTPNLMGNTHPSA